MIKAVIDIGTNSTRLAVADVAGSSVRLLHKAVEITRIGEGMGARHIIQPVPLARTVETVQAFVQRARSQAAESILITATSAVRDAANQRQVAAEIEDKTGLSLLVLPGPEEARLSYQGAAQDFARPAGSLAVLDIGGGSTELVYPTQAGLSQASVNMGAVRLAEAPQLAAQMTDILQGLVTEQLPQDLLLVGVGGTITSLAAMDQVLAIYQSERVHGYRLSRGQIHDWHDRLLAMTDQERRALPGLMPKRSDIITQGAEILLAVLTLLDQAEIIVSDKDLLDALLME